MLPPFDNTLDDTPSGILGTQKSFELFSRRLINAALRMVTRRRLTEHQLRERLEKKISSRWYDMFRANISEDVMRDEIQKILLRFRELGYVNDWDFVELFVRDTLQYRPHGFLWIKMQLAKKGVDSHIIADVLEQLREESAGRTTDGESGDVEYRGARSLAEKKLPTLSRYESSKRYEKLFRFLCSRGYSASMAFRVLDELGLLRR